MSAKLRPTMGFLHRINVDKHNEIKLHFSSPGSYNNSGSYSVAAGLFCADEFVLRARIDRGTRRCAAMTADDDFDLQTRTPITRGIRIVADRALAASTMHYSMHTRCVDVFGCFVI